MSDISNILSDNSNISSDNNLCNVDNILNKIILLREIDYMEKLGAKTTTNINIDSSIEDILFNCIMMKQQIKELEYNKKIDDLCNIIKYLIKN